MRLPVYIAGASADYERARAWASRLEATGLVRITGDWMTAVQHHGVGNDAKLSDDKRRDYASYDLGGVVECQVLWVLWSPHRSNGRAIELGYALRAGRHVIVSGDSRECIFAALAEELETDEQAFERVLEVARENLNRKPIAGSEVEERP